MDAINLDILKQLQEYAQMYFDAIVEANSECGKCKFANGKYTAKDVTKWIYAFPCDDIFNEDIMLESGTFKCKFPYRRIFEVLSDWETMCRAGKLKTLFEIGEDEVKSAKVLTQEKTVLGAFKTKSMKLQHIGGNWWGLPKEIRKGNAITGYYELNGVMFAPGKTLWGDVASAGNQEFCKNRDDADIIKRIKSYIGQHCSENPYCEYITEVARLAGISNKPDQAATPTDTPQIPTESTETVNVSDEGENAVRIAKYRVSRFGGYKIIVGDRAQVKVIAVLMAVNGHNTIEINDEAANIATMGEKPLQIDKPIMQLSDAEVLELVFNSTEPSQPPQIPETVGHATGSTKRATEPRIEPRRAYRAHTAWTQRVGISRGFKWNLPQCKATSIVARYCAMAAPPGYAPPIRGDCTTCKRPTNGHITDLKPP